MIQIDDFEAYCFDLDGTIYVGKKLLPNVKETLAKLRRHDKKVLFITNSPTKTREQCQYLLHSLGVQTNVEEILTASFLSAIYFLENYPQAHIYIIGENALKKELSSFSLNITDNPLDASHVLVGLDRYFTYEKLNNAMIALRNGAKLVVTNPDPVCPVPEGYISDTFAIAKAIQVASDTTIHKIIGKPSTFYANKILKKLRLTNDKILIIGDRLETDIIMGKNNQFSTCLVLTGASVKDDIHKTQIIPDYVIRDLSKLFLK